MATQTKFAKIMDKVYTCPHAVLPKTLVYCHIMDVFLQSCVSLQSSYRIFNVAPTFYQVMSMGLPRPNVEAAKAQAVALFRLPTRSRLPH